MARKLSHFGLPVVSLLVLSLMLMACGQSKTEVALVLPTASDTPTAPASTPTVADTAPATTVAANPDASATPVKANTPVGGTGRVSPTAARSTAAASPKATATPAAPIKPPTGFPGKLSITGPEYALYISRFDGNQPQLVLGKSGVRPGQGIDGPLYDWPTWTSDGSKLAVLSLNVKNSAFDTSDVVMVGADGKNPSKVLSNNPNQPVFLSWSPDGNQLSVLLSGANQLELDLVEATAGASAAPRKVAEGNAIYTGWSPDSQQLLIHATGSTASSSTLALLAAKDAKAQAVPVKVTPSTFRTPAFSGDGTRLAFAVLNAQTGSDEIFVHDKSGTSIGSIEVGGTGASFNWSPTGNKLAHTYQLANSQGLFYKGIALSELDVNPPANGKLTATQIVNEPVAGFFWSPNGKKLAYVTLNSDQSLLVWKIYDLDTKKSSTLTEWLPSQTWLQLIRYFDQYAQSNSIWAPDSKTLVFSGFSKDEAAAISTSQSADDPIPTVYLMPVEGSDTGKLIPVAPGNLAFWAK